MTNSNSNSNSTPTRNLPISKEVEVARMIERKQQMAPGASLTAVESRGSPMIDATKEMCNQMEIVGTEVHELKESLSQSQ